MDKTIAFVTNQYVCDRIIDAARRAADQTGTELVVVGILDSEYEMNPQVVDYLFGASKKNKATMRLLFAEDKYRVMEESIDCFDVRYVVTGMPGSNSSIVYQLWKDFPEKAFFAVDPEGELIEVMSAVHSSSIA